MQSPRIILIINQVNDEYIVWLEKKFKGLFQMFGTISAKCYILSSGDINFSEKRSPIFFTQI